MTKKKILILYVLALFTISCNKSVEKNKIETIEKKVIKPFVFDNEKILNIDQSKILDSIFFKHEQQTANEIVLVTTPNYGEFPSINMFAIDFGIKKMALAKKIMIMVLL